MWQQVVQHAGAVQPSLLVPDAGEAAAFYGQLGFATAMSVPMPGGGVAHAVLSLGGSLVHLDGWDLPPGVPEASRAYVARAVRGPRGLGMVLYVRVEDVAALHATCLRLGLDVRQPPRAMPWGDTVMRVVDPYGYEWGFAQPTA